MQAVQSFQMHMALTKQPWIWHKLMMRSSLPASAFRVGIALMDEFVGRETGKCNPSFARIAGVTGLTERAVRDGVAALVRVGLLVTRKTGFATSLSFFFSRPPAEAEAPSEVTETRHSIRRKSVALSDGNPSPNITLSTLPNEHDGGSECRPPSLAPAVPTSHPIGCSEEGSVVTRVDDDDFEGVISEYLSKGYGHRDVVRAISAQTNAERGDRNGSDGSVRVG